MLNSLKSFMSHRPAQQQQLAARDIRGFWRRDNGIYQRYTE
jgi:hypothetical protein